MLMMNEKVIKDWTIIRSEKGPNLNLFTARYDYLINPRNEKEVKMIVLETLDAANAVVLTKEKKMLIIEQYRFGTGQKTWELPGGKIEQNEPHEFAVKREILEETAYTSANWSYLGSVPSNPVYLNNHCHHWLATDAEKTHFTQLDEAEDIKVLEIGIEEVKQLVRNGKINHPHTLTALSFYFNVWK